MNSKTKVVNVNDEKDVQMPRMLNSPKRQTLVFGAHVGTTPPTNYDSPRTKACKLPSV
jgi:hypothetical protein